MAGSVLLIVDDDPLIADTLHFVLGNEYDVVVADSRVQAQHVLRQLGHPPALALIDLGLPPTPHRPDEGFRLIGELLAHAPAIKIIVLSGQNEAENVRHALAIGAVDFVSKPCDVEQLKGLLREALRMQGAELGHGAEPCPCGLMGDSQPMVQLRTQLSQYADAPFPVLIEGESGSGKELVAACLHHLSKRHDRPYLSLNCAAIAPTLAESMLFGHGKGAFTGASSAHSGYFHDAEDGTLFLDEIGELPLEQQAKLLRVLENGEYQRVGETQTRQSQARIVAATNRNLRDEVRKGRFRMDLYHRLSVFAVHVPPLRELEADRFLLLEHFSAFYARETGRTPFVLDEKAKRLWMDYHFPGNVRELRNVIIRLTAKYAGRTVTADHLAQEFDVGDLEHKGAEGPGGLPYEQALQRIKTTGGVVLDAVLKDWEKAYVDAAMKLSHGNLSQAARLLGVNRTTLYSRMQMYEANRE